MPLTLPSDTAEAGVLAHPHQHLDGSQNQETPLRTCLWACFLGQELEKGEGGRDGKEGENDTIIVSKTKK